MRIIAVLMALGLVSACGADGPPIRPAMTTTIGIGNNGVHGHTHASATRGNVTVGVGVGL